MNDFLLELGKNPQARKMLGALGLPLPIPEPLTRDVGPYSDLALCDTNVAIVAAPGHTLGPFVARALVAAGANPFLADPESLGAAFREPSEAYGRPARPLGALGERERLGAVVLDASGISTVKDLRALYDGLAPLVSRVKKSGRVVVLARELGQDHPEVDAARGAIEGFVRSVSKEVGGKGATANLVRVAKGAEKRLAPVLRFFLSSRSAFVSGQPIVVGTTAKDLPEPVLVRPFEGKVVIVTGAARGIGASTARAFARDGAHVICVDRPDDARELSQLARAIGGAPLLVDVTSEDAARALVDAVRSHGGLDVIVHNAGITRDKTLARMKAEQWDQVLAVNLEAVVRLTRELEPELRDNGRILGLSSVAGIAGNMGQTAYAATKAGVIGFVRAQSKRLADRGITVNAVAPGFIETRMTAAIPFAIREGARRLSALGQGGQPEDVAEALVFLASPGAQGVTGQVLRVCGGALVGA